MAIREIFLANDWNLVRDMGEWSTTTGAFAAKSGLTLTGWLSATKTGAAIHASLSKTPLSERAGTGEYYATVLGTDLTAQLASSSSRSRTTRPWLCPLVSGDSCSRT